MHPSSVFVRSSPSSSPLFHPSATCTCPLPPFCPSSLPPQMRRVRRIAGLEGDDLALPLVGVSEGDLCLDEGSASDLEDILR
mmetsp:Transcript_6455/g.23006  ORF Transcript_6455/g.23006 Transcript_6455/m.23006 type:complete len:82 (+) Transcript_6455:323-568(+)